MFVRSPDQQAGPPRYNCHLCEFATTRLNVIVLHNKSHSAPDRTSLANHARPSVASEARLPRSEVRGSKLFANALSKKRQLNFPTKVSSEPNAKKTKVSRKLKEEKSKEMKEREEKKQAIFGDWSEDENEEEEEKFKINKLLGSPSGANFGVKKSDENISKPFFDSSSPEPEKPKRKRGRPPKKSKQISPEKTESAIDAVNSLIKSKLQPKKTYISSGRAKLDSKTLLSKN